jgi:hypothetical protein
LFRKAEPVKEDGFYGGFARGDEGELHAREEDLYFPGGFPFEFHWEKPISVIGSLLYGLPSLFFQIPLRFFPSDLCEQTL